MPYITLGIAFIITIVLIIVLYNKLTPDNVPDNLAGYFVRILKTVIVVAVICFIALVVASLLFS